MTSELHHGSPEERPMVSAVLGLALMCPAVWLLISVLLRGGHIGLASLRYDLSMLLFFGIGLWLIYQSVAQRRYYVKVMKEDLVRKFVFSEKESIENIQTFLDDARSRFGFKYETRLSSSIRVKQSDCVGSASTVGGNKP